MKYGREFFYKDEVVGWVVGGLLKMGEPFEAMPTKDGYKVAVRHECREQYIKECIWNSFPELRDELKKKGFGKPRTAGRLKPYEPEDFKEDGHLNDLLA